jgi:transcriptional regulator with XRE-family HTH domain
MGPKRIPLSDEIRQTLADCGQSRYAISKATGIAESTLSRFLAGERGLPMKTLDKLADYLDLHITTGTRRRTKKGSGNRGDRF